MIEPETGLKYLPVKFQSFTKPVWVLKDHDGVVWVDVRSAIECLGMSWGKWRLALAPRRGGCDFRTCLDRNAKETLLIEELFFVRWLSDIEPMLKMYPVWVESKVASLRGAWRLRYDEVARENFPNELTQDKALKERKRKITADVVIRLHHLRRVVGNSIATAAKSLEISVSAVKSIEAGTYKAWTPDAKESWRQTFGNL